MPEYLVRLPMQVSADSPSDAVQGMVEQLARHGLRCWQYRVDLLTQDGTVGDFVGVFDGDGRPADAMTHEAEPDDDASDEELLAYAERLDRE